MPLGCILLKTSADRCCCWQAPTCITFELWRADTMELICKQQPIYGNGDGQAFAEEGYINVRQQR